MTSAMQNLRKAAQTFLSLPDVLGLTLRRVVFRNRVLKWPRICDLSMPDEDTRYRVLYQLFKEHVPPALVGVVNDIRNAEFALPQRSGVEPAVVVRSVMAARDEMEWLNGPKAFGVPKRDSTRSCVSCGKMPVGKYRWKHRICGHCSFLLQKAGCVSYAGSQIQSGLQVPTCYPGLVKRDCVELKPSPKKWADVSLQGGKVLLSKPDMNSKVSANQYSAFDPAQLESLRRPRDPTYKCTGAGIYCSGAYPVVSANTAYNQGKALLGRAFRMSKVPRPQESTYIWLDMFKGLLLPNYVASRMETLAWLEGMPSRRRKALARALDSYERTGWLRKYERFSAFVKTELLPGFSKDAKHLLLLPLESMLDRLIQGPHDVTHCIAGPCLKPLLAVLKDRWGPDGPIFYGSASPEKLHLWLQRLVTRAGTYFWCDYSMYDNTHSLPSWGFLRRLYRESGVGDRPDFWRVLDAWQRPRGTCGPFKYEARVMNASGRDDTALANAILNGFAAYLSACAAYLRKDLFSLTPGDVEGCFSDIFVSVCGDDSLGRIPLMTETGQLEFNARMSSNIALFGFEAKLRTSNKLFDAVYLGMRPYPTEKGWFWGKTIGRASYKMGWLVDKGQDVMAHVTGIAEMHSLCSAHVPVLSDLAERILTLREGAKRTPVVLDPNKPWEWTYKSGVKYDRLTLQAVAETYSAMETPVNKGQVDFCSTAVSVEQIEALIGKIRSIESLPCCLDDDLWRLMILMDDL
nr:MAG: RNA-dependent RNA polymerase [Hangzhou yanvirus-like virus 1]